MSGESRLPDPPAPARSVPLDGSTSESVLPCICCRGPNGTAGPTRQSRNDRARAEAALRIRDAALALWVEAELQSPGSDATQVALRLEEGGFIEAWQQGGRVTVRGQSRTGAGPSLRLALKAWISEMRRDL